MAWKVWAMTGLPSGAGWRKWPAFGIQAWFYRDVASLSGGQKQLLNLASVMATMQPEVLILDEPTSQLDPLLPPTFWPLWARIHQDLGATIVITEHRLDEVLPWQTGS